MSAYGSTVSDVMVEGGTRCWLDTVTYTSPEFDELETIVEVCEPLYETEKPTMQAPVEQGPEPVIFVSPHPVSEQHSRMGGRSLHSSAPGMAPPLGFSASRSYGFVSGVPGGISVRDTLPRPLRRATPNEGNDHDRQTTGCKSP